MILDAPGHLPAGTLVLLDLEVNDLNACMDVVLQAADEHLQLDPDYREALRGILCEHADRGPDVLEHAMAVIHEQVGTPGPDLQILARMNPPLNLHDAHGQPTHFVYLLLTHDATHPHAATVGELAHQLHDPAFLAEALQAPTPEALDEVYARWLDQELRFARVPPELRAPGGLLSGVAADVRRRLPSYASDWMDGLRAKSVASTIFLFFACLAPSVAFGGLLSVMTDGTIGVVEALIATSISGLIYALLSGQPLSILGSTGPVTVFIGMLYALCATLGIPYLPTLAWIGLWTSLFLWILVITNASTWIRFFTRFTDDTFAALIAMIFVYEALKDIIGVFTDHKVSYATALLSLVLAIGTYLVAGNLSRFRRSVYLRATVREFLADFGPTIAILTMTMFAFLMADVELETLAVPDTVAPSINRSWLVNPLDAPTWVWGAAAVPALLGAILVYLDQHITVRLVNSPDNKLKKGAGYHLDLAIVATLVAGLSMFGLPWTVAATVRSLNHVRSLTDTTTAPGQPTQVAVVETRVTGFAIHLLMAGSLLLLPLLRLIPMSVLFGLFLYMGVASTKGNQLFERLRLWLTDPVFYPPTHYLRAVPGRATNAFTVVQVACLALLWGVKASPAGIVFPLFIALLVPVRMVLGRFLDPAHLALLDAEAVPEPDAEIGR